MAGTGRPRDVTIDERVLAAVLALLAERGYAGLRIDDVVTVSGVAKTTIYRRWPSLAHLVVAAVQTLVGDRDFSRTTDPEADLKRASREWMASLGRAGSAVGAVALDIHRQSDPELRRIYRASLIDPVRDAMIAMIRDGQAQGVFRADADPEAAADAVIGAGVYRLMILHEPVDAAQVDAVIEVVLGGLRIAGAVTGPGEVCLC